MIIITTNIRLYKGISIDTKEWISGFLLKKNEHYFIQKDDFSAEVYFDSICLQVNLKDMNQKEVYENDLLQVIDPDGSSAEIMIKLKCMTRKRTGDYIWIWMNLLAIPILKSLVIFAIN